MRNLPLTFSFVVPVKSKVEISQNFVAFSEYMNFTKICNEPGINGNKQIRFNKVHKTKLNLQIKC